MLSITKARVNGVDKDVTKTGEDRRIVLCPRAIAVIERQLRLRERLIRAGLIDHDHLFFTDSGAPIPDVKYPYVRWQRTLRRLAIRYRKPYMARHTSVSWNLMIGRNPLLVAKEHGHRLTTMLSVYAAWAEGAVETDTAVIRESMNRTDRIEPSTGQALPTTAIRLVRSGTGSKSLGGAGRRNFAIVEADRSPSERFGSRFAISRGQPHSKSLKERENIGGKGGTRIEYTPSLERAAFDNNL